jgi:hypothetical protein
MARFISGAATPGNSDQSRAIAAVTNGAAALVPSSVRDCPSDPRLVTCWPGALRPRLPTEPLRFDPGVGLPSRSHAITGSTHGWRVMTELLIVPSLPDAATTSTRRRAASSRACSSWRATGRDAPVSTALKFRTRAPASIVSIIAVASSSGVHLKICPPSCAISPKIGRTSNVQFGAIAGALLPRFAARIPATKVPCIQAALLGCAQEYGEVPLSTRMLSALKSGWVTATGPSMRPITTSRLPLVRFIRGVSLTSSRAAVDTGRTRSDMKYPNDHGPQGGRRLVRVPEIRFLHNEHHYMQLCVSSPRWPRSLKPGLPR